MLTRLSVCIFTVWLVLLCNFLNSERTEPPIQQDAGNDGPPDQQSVVEEQSDVHSQADQEEQLVVANAADDLRENERLSSTLKNSHDGAVEEEISSSVQNAGASKDLSDDDRVSRSKIEVEVEGVETKLGVDGLVHDAQDESPQEKDFKESVDLHEDLKQQQENSESSSSSELKKHDSVSDSRVSDELPLSETSGTTVDGADGDFPNPFSDDVLHSPKVDKILRHRPARDVLDTMVIYKPDNFGRVKMEQYIQTKLNGRVVMDYHEHYETHPERLMRKYVLEDGKVEEERTGKTEIIDYDLEEAGTKGNRDDYDDDPEYEEVEKEKPMTEEEKQGLRRKFSRMLSS